MRIKLTIMSKTSGILREIFYCSKIPEFLDIKFYVSLYTKNSKSKNSKSKNIKSNEIKNKKNPKMTKMHAH